MVTDPTVYDVILAPEQLSVFTDFFTQVELGIAFILFLGAMFVISSWGSHG